ncbi:hypothetical protein [Fluviicola sp.]|uniref:hypothetical protein n=1 Tax=Fluviicola sp. TaxID=1917219 RepID=UPI003D2C7C53
MKKLLCLLILLPFYGKPQDSLKTELQMILLNSADSSLVAYAFTTLENFIENPSFVDSSNHVILDSILTKGYKFEFDYPFYESRFESDSSYAKPFIKYLSCADLGTFLRKSNMRFYLIHYGYASHSNYPELTEKYGIQVMNMGCIVDSSYGKYIGASGRLLNIRNGVGWYNQYIEDYRKLIEKE